MAGSVNSPEDRAPSPSVRSVVYVDSEAGAFAYRDAVRMAVEEAGYNLAAWWLGVTPIVDRSNQRRELEREALAADVVILRFGGARLEDHWAFDALGWLGEHASLLIVTLDAANRFAKTRLDARLAQPSLLIEGPDGLAAALKAALPRGGRD